MPELNAVGDLVLTEAAEFRALADPLALRLTDRLWAETSATTAELAALTGASEADVDARLTELENLLAPYLTRTAEDAPPDARRVRLLAYFMPEAAS